MRRKQRNLSETVLDMPRSDGGRKQGCAHSECRRPDMATWETDPLLLDTITNGKRGGMPAFGDDLTPEQISRLLRCVVRGFGKSTGKRPACGPNHYSTHGTTPCCFAPLQPCESMCLFLIRLRIFVGRGRGGTSRNA